MFDVKMRKRQNTWKSNTGKVYHVIFKPKHLKLEKIFARAKFGLVPIKTNKVTERMNSATSRGLE